MPPIQHWSDDIWVAQLQADQMCLTDELTQLVNSLKDSEHLPHVVIDLSKVDHLVSSHLSQLLQVRKETITRDRKLRLSHPNNQLWAIFLTTGLDKVFTFSENVSTALAGLQIES
ncbi:MAG: STAS domain-containing protein [Phycisphaeraceae bacterium]|nr:STAS domain-containing protein [Phycisphaeraceae bacterium]